MYIVHLISIDLQLSRLLNFSILQGLHILRERYIYRNNAPEDLINLFGINMEYSNNKVIKVAY